MTNQEIARMFSDIAEILELKGENVFKIRVYRRAALTIEGLSRNVRQMSGEELRKIPCIREKTEENILREIDTGKCCKERRSPARVLPMAHELLVSRAVSSPHEFRGVLAS
nr:helix-hairpin-helix domain-containing protein [Geobacteraceae bacterium]